MNMLHYKIKELMPANAPPKEQRQASRQLLLQLLTEHCGIGTLPAMNVRFGGKPYFPQYPHIHFNLSHCKSAVMAVISDKKVGCDIEDILSEKCLNMMPVVFKQEDIDIILASENPSLEMTKMWTRKQALVKHNGYIPDDPAEWPSRTTYMEAGESLSLITKHIQESPYVFSIAFFDT